MDCHMRVGKMVRAINQIHEGFAYIALLIFISILGVGLLAVSEVWEASAQRQRMAQLEWAGQQYVNAIESYYYSGSPAYTLPNKIQELVEDVRFTPPRKHLRELYANPIILGGGWLEIKRGHGIAGVQAHIEGGEVVVKSYIFHPRSVEH